MAINPPPRIIPNGRSCRIENYENYLDRPFLENDEDFLLLLLLEPPPPIWQSANKIDSMKIINIKINFLERRVFIAIQIMNKECNMIN